MNRRIDWPEKLAEYIESRRDEPFVWGTHDCAQFAAAAIEVMCFDNPAAPWAYASEAEAQALIVAAGSLEALVTQALGPAVHPSRAGRGDVVLATLELGDTVGVCLGNDCAFAADPGVTFRPRTVATLAWKI